MPDRTSELPKTLPFVPGAGLPLSGLTMLLVEDSRFASEALRLLCQRSGARLQRTDSLAGAWRHLAVYRPDVAVIDLGLPDGSGLDLIARLSRGYGGFCGALIAISGDTGGEAAAMAAGAAVFLEKPLDRLEAFQAVVLHHLARRALPRGVASPRLTPDRQALRDDLHHAAGLAATGSPAPYLAAFVQSLARSCGDSALETLARNAAAMGVPGMSRLHRALTDRLAALPPPFAAEGRS